MICRQTCAPGAKTIGTNAFTERMGLQPSQAGFPGKPCPAPCQQNPWFVFLFALMTTFPLFF